MDQQHKLARVYLLLIDFVLPVPLTGVLGYLWWRRTGSAPFALYVLTLGVLFGYIFPGIGTNLLHLWKFNGPWRLGNYFIHHGFLYAPYLALVCYVAFAAGAPLTLGNVVRTILSAAFIQSVVSCHHDICGVRTGLIEIRRSPARLGQSPVEVVTSFGVVGFGLVGAGFAGSCLLAYQTLVIRGLAGVGTFLLLVAAGLAILGVPALYFLVRERALIVQVWRERRGATPTRDRTEKRSCGCC